MPLLPAGMPAPPSFRKFNPADSPIMFLGAHLGHRADVRPRRLRGNDDRAAHLDGQRRLAGAGAGRAEIRGPRAGRSRTSCMPSSIGINEVNQALQNWNVNLPTGQLFGPSTTYNIKAARAADERRGVQAGHRRLPQRRAGPARPGRHRPRQRRGQQERLVALHEGRRAGARSTCR